MSSTRKAASGKPFRQERFASSAEFERGLLANLVARRCDAMECSGDRELVWFIQFLSHQQGGLKAIADVLLKKYSDRIGTPSMRKWGCCAGQIYDAEKVKRARLECNARLSDFPLRDEIDANILDMIREDGGARMRTLRREAETHPLKYPAKAFLDLCRDELSETALENLLREMCLNPAVQLNGNWPWWFAEFTTCLREFQTEWIAQRSAGTVTTEIGTMVADALNYSLETKCLVLMEGNPRTGKTFAAKAWCEQHPGRARYVQVPCTNDEIGFFRAIAKALGVSINLNSKSQELRQRIEEALQGGNLALVLDEAHYLWPNLIDPRTLPARVNWIMTALVNYGVPVALIATPQFLKTQKMVEEKTRWTSEQFTGRLGHYEPLPQTVSDADLQKVAGALLPEGDASSLETLVVYAKSSAKYLAGIEAAVRRARYLAKLEGRDKAARADIKRVIRESVIPSDNALAIAMAEPQRNARKRSVSPVLMESKPVIKDRLSDRGTSNLLDGSSSQTASRIRLEARRENDVLTTG